ncbi:MAG: hypothetical protein ACQESR_22825 [Planctomycetota bacterium]
METGSTQAVLPLVGLAADTVIRDRYIQPNTAGLRTRRPTPRREWPTR